MLVTFDEFVELVISDKTLVVKFIILTFDKKNFEYFPALNSVLKNEIGPVFLVILLHHNSV